MCAVGSVTFHIHAERRPKSGVPTVQNIGQNVTVITSTNLDVYSNATRAMQDIFTRDIAVAFAQTWHAQAIETGYLASDTFLAAATPSRTLEAARVFSPPPTPSRIVSVPPQTYTSPSTPTPPSRTVPVPSQIYTSTPSTPTRRAMELTKSFPPPYLIKPSQKAPSSLAVQSAKKSRSPIKSEPSTRSATTATSSTSVTSSELSSSSLQDSVVIAGPNVSYRNNIFQAISSLPQEVLDLTTDLGYGGAEDTKFITHLYLNVGQSKWFSMMKNRFAVDDTVILALVQCMKN